MRQRTTTFSLSLTPWSWALLEKLPVTLLLKNLPTFLWNPNVKYRVHKSPPPDWWRARTIQSILEHKYKDNLFVQWPCASAPYSYARQGVRGTKIGWDKMFCNCYNRPHRGEENSDEWNLRMQAISLSLDSSYNWKLVEQPTGEGTAPTETRPAVIPAQPPTQLVRGSLSKSKAEWS
jgi:hypothetical protein